MRAYCNEIGPGGWFICCEPVGHAGDHVARTGPAMVVDQWPPSPLTPADKIQALLRELNADEQGAVLRFVKHVLADRGET